MMNTETSKASQLLKISLDEVQTCPREISIWPVLVFVLVLVLEINEGLVGVTPIVVFFPQPSCAWNVTFPCSLTPLPGKFEVPMLHADGSAAPVRFEVRSSRSIILETPAIPALISRWTSLPNSLTVVLRANNFSLKPRVPFEIESLYLLKQKQ